LKHITYSAVRLELQCSWEDFVAVDDNVLWLNEHQKPVMRAVGWRTQVW